MSLIASSTCINCHYFKAEGDITKTNLGRCFRFPRQRDMQPQQNALGQVVMAESANYPLQQADDWCGEFKQSNKIVYLETGEKANDNNGENASQSTDS